MDNKLMSIEETYKLIEVPPNLSDEEKAAWEYAINILKKSTKYRKTLADTELIRQFVQHKIMRDRAWIEWTKKPERYIRIVTGLCSDGVTPKIVVKENEYYRTLNDCNKHIEKLLTDLKLTPEKRTY